MDILKLTILTLFTVFALFACDYLGDSLTSNTEVTVNVGGTSTSSVATVTPKTTVTPTVTTTPTTEAAAVVTPNVF